MKSPRPRPWAGGAAEFSIGGLQVGSGIPETLNHLLEGPISLNSCRSGAGPFLITATWPVASTARLALAMRLCSPYCRGSPTTQEFHEPAWLSGLLAANGRGAAPVRRRRSGGSWLPVRVATSRFLHPSGPLFGAVDSQVSTFSSASSRNWNQLSFRHPSQSVRRMPRCRRCPWACQVTEGQVYSARDKRDQRWTRWLVSIICKRRQRTSTSTAILQD